MPGNADTSLLDGCPFDANKSAYSSPAKPPPTLALYTKPTWTAQQKHLFHPQLASGGQQSSTTGGVYTSSSLDRQQQRTQSPGCVNGGVIMDNNKYPDLLDISNLNLSTKSRVNSQTQRVAAAMAPKTELVLSTYPRQRASPARTAADSSNIQLAQRMINTTAHQQHPQPIVSSSNANLLRSSMSPVRTHSNANHQRSNSINIIQALTMVDTGANDDNRQHVAQWRSNLNNNPAASASTSSSSPTPPATNSSPPTVVGYIGNGGVRSTTGPTTSAHTYDYHAAQLERFLEEYRNLQQQLCRMKETCDSIRLKEVPHIQQRQLTSTTTPAATQSDAAILQQLQQLQRKTNKSTGGSATAAAPRQPPDPPPYWLHRSAMLNRLQESGRTPSSSTAPVDSGLQCDGDSNVTDNGNNI